MTTRGACRTADQSLFFPEKGEEAKINEAKMICMQCPVFRECNEFFQRYRPEYGVWAAQMTPKAERGKRGE